MQQNQALDEYIALIKEYTIFLEKMLMDEKERFAALSSRELPRIEHSIAVTQANTKQIENFEAKRLGMQVVIGFEGASFRELLAGLPPEQAAELQPLFTRFGNMVEEIRFRNDKSMAIARDNMIDISPESVFAPTAGTKPNSPYAKMQEEQRELNRNFEKKI